MKSHEVQKLSLRRSNEALTGWRVIHLDSSWLVWKYRNQTMILIPGVIELSKHIHVRHEARV
jgi:hypothetical protein